eukprot:9060937-Heterocapsa_arctica.AAC.1
MVLIGQCYPTSLTIYPTSLADKFIRPERRLVLRIRMLRDSHFICRLPASSRAAGVYPTSSSDNVTRQVLNGLCD